MQDGYSGDIGDFAKYGLLRGLFARSGKPSLRLGIVWYRVPDESHNADGRHTAYLEQTEGNSIAYEACDPELYRSLRRVVRSRRRTIAGATEAGILPVTTTYYDHPLTFKDIRQADRRGAREAWLEDALAATERADAVFADPDNGFEVKVGRTAIKGPKYAFFDELKQFLDRDQSLIVYQHASRSGTIANQLKARFDQIDKRLGMPAPWALWFRRLSARFFFVIPHPAHAEILKSRTRAFLASPWGTHFSECPPGP